MGKRPSKGRQALERKRQPIIDLWTTTLYGTTTYRWTRGKAHQRFKEKTECDTVMIGYARHAKTKTMGERDTAGQAHVRIPTYQVGQCFTLLGASGTFTIKSAQSVVAQPHSFVNLTTVCDR